MKNAYNLKDTYTNFEYMYFPIDQMSLWNFKNFFIIGNAFSDL